MQSEDILFSSLIDKLAKNKCIQKISDTLLPTQRSPIFQFQIENSLEDRIKLSQDLTAKYPDKIPILVEFQDLTIKPLKFLVQFDEIVLRLISKIRVNQNISFTKSIFLMTETHQLLAGSAVIGHIYEEYLHQKHLSRDKILYLMVYNENTFG